MRKLISLLLLSCTMFLNAQTYSFEAISSMENEGFEDAKGLFEFKDKLYFEATKSTGLYLCTVDTDNKTESRIELHSTDHGNLGEYDFTKAVAGGRIFFLKRNGSKKELWQTNDGENFQKIADPFDGLKGSNIDNFYATDDYLYYTADTEDNGKELFSCSTSSLTVKCLHIMAGTEPTDIAKPCLYNNKLYFGAKNATNGMELWSYNEADGAVMVQDYAAGSEDFSPEDFITFDSKLFFTATTTATGKELFSFDGANIELAAELKSGNDDSNPTNKLIVNNTLYFLAKADGKVTPLFHSFKNGTATLVDFADANGLAPSYLTAFDGKIFGQGKTTTTGTELFYLDGNVRTMIDVEPRIKEMHFGPIVREIIVSGRPKDLMVHGNHLYFTAEVNSSRNIFKLKKDNATPVEKLQAKPNFTIFPNPATSYFTITSSDNQIEGKVQVFDLSGKVALSQTIQSQNEKVYINSLTPGIYVVSFKSDTETFMQKVRIQ